MEYKRQQFQVNGINQDTSISNFPKDKAYDIHNMRITVTSDNSLLCLEKEKGTEVSYVLGQNVYIVGIVDCIDYLCLFLIDSDQDKICLFNPENQSLDIIYQGKLDFNLNNDIKGIYYYEAENIKKVYWVDGINPNRCININNRYTKRLLNSDIDTQFDFIKSIDFSNIPRFEVKKNNTGGNFTPGVIQYAYNYYNKYSSETALVEVSGLFYLATEQGVANDKKVSCSFQISLSDYDTNFDYIRFYAIERNSLNGQVKSRIIAEQYIENMEADTIINIIDNGVIGESIDSSLLYYIGGTNIIASTLCQKDNTLFLGNLKENNVFIDSNVKKQIKQLLENKLTFKNRNPSSDNEYKTYDNYIGSLESGDNTTFKYGETYRIGIQFQYNNGLYSDVVYINDITNHIYPRAIKTGDNNVDGDTISFACVSLNVEEDISNEIKQLVPNTIGARLMYVEPTLNDWSVFNQGIISPTVYSPSFREPKIYSNMASWILRPFTNALTDDEFNNGSIISGEIQSCDEKFAQYKVYKGVPYYIDYYYIAANSQDPANPETTITTDTYRARIIKIDNISDTSNRVVINQLEETIYKNAINTLKRLVYSKDNLSSYLTEKRWKQGKYNDPVNDNLPSILYKEKDQGNIVIEDYIKVYPKFHIDSEIIGNDIFRQDYSVVTLNSPDVSLSESIDISECFLRINGYATLRKEYSDYIINADKIARNPLGGKVELFYDKNSKLKNGLFWKDSVSTKANYYDTQNIAKNRLVAFKIYMWHRNIMNADVTSITDANSVREAASTIKTKVFSNIRDLNCSTYLQYDKVVNVNPKTCKLIKENNNGTVYKISDDNNYISDVDILLNSKYYYILGQYIGTTTTNNIEAISYIDEDVITSSDIIQMKYKSSTHILLELEQNIIKVLENVEEITRAFVSNELFFIGELYRSVPNQYGGAIDENQNNFVMLHSNWIPISNNGYFNANSGFSLMGIFGDTYYQRWDCLKTFPYTKEDKNQVIDITSLYIESRMNLDGRTDQRGRINILNADNTNYNLINDVYSQHNNFFNYTNPQDNDIKQFPNQIIFSNTKVNGENVDTWQHINAASIVDLDGNKGKLTDLRVFNNQVISFQENGISRINFNNRVQVSTSDNVPIEITNSGKVDGVTYITDKYGCKSNHAIQETPKGIYFIDDNHKSLMLLGESIENISLKQGMASWFKDKKATQFDIYSWFNDTDNINNVVLNYDKTTEDLYITTTKECLAFNEQLNTFTGTYDYNRIYHLYNYNGKSFSIHNNETDGTAIYSMYNEDSNQLFNNHLDYGITLIANDNFIYPKIFYMLDFRTNDSFEMNTKNVIKNTSEDSPVFHNMTVTTDYQQSSSNIDLLKKKFRTWRWLVNRANNNMKDRIYDNWCKIDIKGYSNQNIKVYDLGINYYV